ncbi:hypothetical protein BpHYR1_011229 [Brachionus plicatilis]|uniref:Uncharacterized protein n=1 Tax=Brachionus plicatilis TaxID=10195 RepID=A0A3M7SN94_BRAPC|nr:hypothetical protein BpHYR1_011229 [Brachionus plicatilis]
MNIIYFYELLTDAFSDLFRPQKIDHNQNIQLDFFSHLKLSLFRSVHLRRPLSDISCDFFSNQNKIYSIVVTKPVPTNLVTNFGYQLVMKQTTRISFYKLDKTPYLVVIL